MATKEQYEACWKEITGHPEYKAETDFFKEGAISREFTRFVLDTCDENKVTFDGMIGYIRQKNADETRSRYSELEEKANLLQNVIKAKEEALERNKEALEQSRVMILKKDELLEELTENYDAIKGTPAKLASLENDHRALEAMYADLEVKYVRLGLGAGAPAKS